MPQLLTKKPPAFEHQRRRVCYLIKGRIKQEKESTSLSLSLVQSMSGQAIKPCSEDARIPTTADKNLILGTISKSPS